MAAQTKRKTSQRGPGRPKGSTNSRKSTSKRKSSTGNSSRHVMSRDVKIEVSILLMLALVLILVLGNLGVKAIVVRSVTEFFFGVFGVIEYVFPLVLFVMTWFALANMENKRATLKIACTFIAMWVLCGLIQLGRGFKKDYLYYFEYSAQNRSGGGFLGGLIAKTFGNLFGKFGAYVITIILFLIFICIVTGKTFLINLFRLLKSFFAGVSDIAHNGMDENEDYEFVDVGEDDDQQYGKTLMIRRNGNDEKKLARKSVLTNLKDDIGNEVSSSGKIELKVPRRGQIQMDLTEPEPEKVPAETIDLTDISKAFEIKPAQSEPEKVTKQDTAIETENIENIVSQDSRSYSQYKLPSTRLLRKGQTSKASDADAREKAIKLNTIFESFGVKATVVGFTKGPSVTRFEIQPDIGVKVKRISDLSDDIKLGLAVADIRIEAPIPGKALVGIEVPNDTSSGVMLRDLLESKEFVNSKSKISFAVGRDISGNVVVSDIAKLPHLLIGGSTGSGKSVFMNTLIMSILFKASPEEVKFFMIDPKMIELSVYNDLPHLMVPVVTDPKKAAGVLNYAVIEMTKRYQLFNKLQVKGLSEYNKRIKTFEPGEEKNTYIYQSEVYKVKPQIVIIVDEFADLMMVAKGEVEESVVRLAQLARAAGIHLILATQRPSVDVITGLIKANMNSRLALLVSSGIDSRTIIDQVGAEKLLGNGDMLYSPMGVSHPMRIQGAYVSGEEVESVVRSIVEKNGTLSSDENVEEEITSAMNSSSIIGGEVSIGSGSSDLDEYFVEAGNLIVEKQKASVGMLQRQFRIGFNRAARIMDQLHEHGIVSEEEGTKPRKVLVGSIEEFHEKIKE